MRFYSFPLWVSLSFILLLPVYQSALAEVSAPIPAIHPTKDLEEQLQITKAREKELETQMNALKADLKDKRQEMVGVAQNIKSNEKKLLDLEESIAQKTQEQLKIEVRLDKDRGAISELILALERVRRVPPEALLARPGAPLETAQSAMLLESVLPRVYTRAAGLRTDLQELKEIIASLKKDQDEAIETAKDLEGSHKKLGSLLNERESLYSRTAKDVKKQQAELEKISLEARSLRDLVTRIERKQKEEDERRENATVTEKVAMPATPIPSTGSTQLPISGLIQVGYGKTDEIGAVSQGIKISGRPRALVVAPMGGVIDYAGPFKGYGQIIILKHQKGYHSLVAGLDKIDTVVGQAVSAGEPIGKMGHAGSSGLAPVLYYELRYNGHPVNPSKKIAGLP